MSSLQRQGWAALYEQERQTIEDYLAQLAEEDDTIVKKHAKSKKGTKK